MRERERHTRMRERERERESHEHTYSTRERETHTHTFLCVREGECQHYRGCWEREREKERERERKKWYSTPAPHLLSWSAILHLRSVWLCNKTSLSLSRMSQTSASEMDFCPNTCRIKPSRETQSIEDLCSCKFKKNLWGRVDSEDPI